MPRPDAPAPLRRRGPRPLLLHLALGQAGIPQLDLPGTMLGSSLSAGSPNWSAAWPSWSTAAPDAQLVAGIAAYRRHPYHRTLADPPVLWSEEETRLLDYGATAPQAADPASPPVLFVPSLVNRSYVLDLAERHSMLRALAASGLRPVLLDWGWPGEIERRFTLTDYIVGRLERAMQALGGRLILAGYCMGGLLALAAAQRRPDLVAALALLATPWDFHAAGTGQPQLLGAALPVLEPVLAATGTLPIDALQALFAMLEPGAVPAKYRAFAAMDQAGARARLFVALEDWVNDGVPLAAPVARECLGQWYGANAPANDAWRIAGQVVRPEAIACPSFIAIPARDRIVPPESAAALAKRLPGGVLHQPGAGHIGMAAGPRAAASLWQPLTAWLHACQGGGRVTQLATRRRARPRPSAAQP